MSSIYLHRWVTSAVATFLCVGVPLLSSSDPSHASHASGRCWVAGLFLSVLRGLLSELDLDVLRDAYFGVCWQPLSTVVQQYAAFIVSHQADPVSAEELAAAYAWRSAAPAILAELTRDSALVRKVLNGRAAPPAALARPYALLWFYPRGHSLKAGRSTAHNPLILGQSGHLQGGGRPCKHTSMGGDETWPSALQGRG